MTWVIHHYFTFESFFLILPSVLRICSQFQSYRHTINISPPLIRLMFNTTHFKRFYTSPMHHILTHTLPSSTSSQKMTYLISFDHTNTLRLLPAIYQFQIASLYIYISLSLSLSVSLYIYLSLSISIYLSLSIYLATWPRRSRVC